MERAIRLVLLSAALISIATTSISATEKTVPSPSSSSVVKGNGKGYSRSSIHFALQNRMGFVKSRAIDVNHVRPRRQERETRVYATLHYYHGGRTTPMKPDAATAAPQQRQAATRHRINLLGLHKTTRLQKLQQVVKGNRRAQNDGIKPAKPNRKQFAKQGGGNSKYIRKRSKRQSGGHTTPPHYYYGGTTLPMRPDTTVRNYHIATTARDYVTSTAPHTATRPTTMRPPNTTTRPYVTTQPYTTVRNYVTTKAAFPVTTNRYVTTQKPTSTVRSLLTTRRGTKESRSIIDTRPPLPNGVVTYPTASWQSTSTSKATTIKPLTIPGKTTTGIPVKKPFPTMAGASFAAAIVYNPKTHRNRGPFKSILTKLDELYYIPYAASVRRRTTTTTTTSRTTTKIPH